MILLFSCNPYKRMRGEYRYHNEGKGVYSGAEWYLQLKPDSTFIMRKNDLNGGKLDTCYSYYSGKYNILDKRIYVYENIEVHDISDMLRSPRTYVFIIQDHKTFVHGEKVFVKIRNRDKH